MPFDTGQIATNIHKMFLFARICLPSRLASLARLFLFPSAISVDAVGPLSLPPLPPPLTLSTWSREFTDLVLMRKDGGGDPPSLMLLWGGYSTRNGGKLWRRLFGISMASVTWNLFPFFLHLMFVLDPSAGCCVVMTSMIVTDG